MNSRLPVTLSGSRSGMPASPVVTSAAAIVIAATSGPASSGRHPGSVKPPSCVAVVLRAFELGSAWTSIVIARRSSVLRPAGRLPGFLALLNLGPHRSGTPDPWQPGPGHKRDTTSAPTRGPPAPRTPPPTGPWSWSTCSRSRRRSGWVEQGTIVHPAPARDAAAARLAEAVGGVLAAGRREATASHPWSLSPAALRAAPAPSHLVLPSPNGSAIAAVAAAAPTVVAGSLRNARRSARGSASAGGRSR